MTRDSGLPSSRLPLDYRSADLRSADLGFHNYGQFDLTGGVGGLRAGASAPYGGIDPLAAYRRETELDRYPYSDLGSTGLYSGLSSSLSADGYGGLGSLGTGLSGYGGLSSTSALNELRFRSSLYDDRLSVGSVQGGYASSLQAAPRGAADLLDPSRRLYAGSYLDDRSNAPALTGMGYQGLSSSSSSNLPGYPSWWTPFSWA